MSIVGKENICVLYFVTSSTRQHDNTVQYRQCGIRDPQQLTHIKLVISDNVCKRIKFKRRVVY